MTLFLDNNIKVINWVWTTHINFYFSYVSQFFCKLSPFWFRDLKIFNDSTDNYLINNATISWSYNKACKSQSDKLFEATSKNFNFKTQVNRKALDLTAKTAFDICPILHWTKT